MKRDRRREIGRKGERERERYCLCVRGGGDGERIGGSKKGKAVKVECGQE